MCEIVLLRQRKVEELVIDWDVGYVTNLVDTSNIRVKDT